MQASNYSLVCAALSPARHTSIKRWPFADGTRTGRRARLASLHLLRPFDPPAADLSRVVTLWSMYEDDPFMHSLLCAGVMSCSGILRPAVVAGSLREQLVASMGFERFKRSLLYEGGSPCSGIDGLSERRIRMIGLAVMYRFARGISVAASRHALRRMPPGDRNLGEAMAIARRLNLSACDRIGRLVVSSFEGDMTC